MKNINLQVRNCRQTTRFEPPVQFTETLLTIINYRASQAKTLKENCLNFVSAHSVTHNNWSVTHTTCVVVFQFSRYIQNSSLMHSFKIDTYTTKMSVSTKPSIFKKTDQSLFLWEYEHELRRNPYFHSHGRLLHLHRHRRQP